MNVHPMILIGAPFMPIPKKAITSGGITTRPIIRVSVGLSLLDRLIVTTHRAGCAPICLIAKSMPLVPRTRALGIDITLASAIPELEEPALLIDGAVFVEAADLQQVIEGGRQLFSADG